MGAQRKMRRVKGMEREAKMQSHSAQARTRRIVILITATTGEQTREQGARNRACLGAWLHAPGVPTASL